MCHMITVDFKVTLKHESQFFSLFHIVNMILYQIIPVMTGLGEGYEDYMVHRFYGTSGWGRRGHPIPFKTLTRPGRSVWGYGEWNLLSVSLTSMSFCVNYEMLLDFMTDKSLTQQN